MIFVKNIFQSLSKKREKKVDVNLNSVKLCGKFFILILSVLCVFAPLRDEFRAIALDMYLHNVYTFLYDDSGNNQMGQQPRAEASVQNGKRIGHRL